MNQTLTARLALFGRVPTPATLTVEPRPRSERILRAWMSLFGMGLLGTILFIVPPHAEPVLFTWIAGIYWFRKHLSAEFEVVEFKGICPNCHHPLEVKAGTTLKFPHSVVCFGCKSEADLELGEAPPLQDLPPSQTQIQTSKPAEIRPLRVWSPSSSEW